MKKLLMGIAFFYVYAYGMDNNNSVSSYANVLKHSNSTSIVLKGNDDSYQILNKEFLPEVWCRLIDDQKLAQERDQAETPLMRLDTVSSVVLPLVKDSLYLMKYILLLGAEQKATWVAYKYFQTLNVSLEQAIVLLKALDYLQTPKVLLAGLARLFVQLTKGEHPSCSS